MTADASAGADDLKIVIREWTQHLRARNLSKGTIKSYRETAEELTEFLERSGISTSADQLTNKTVEGFLVASSEREVKNRPGHKVSSATVAKHYRNLQQLSRYLVKEKILQVDIFVEMQPPKVEEKIIPLLSPDQISKLLTSTDFPRFEDLRDHAMIRMLLDSGGRISEVIGMSLDDVDLETGTVVVLGKGNKFRVSPYGEVTSRALTRYLRARKRHPKSVDSRKLWITRKGDMTSNGARTILKRRGLAVGIRGLHPHMFRHQFAHDWLSAGGGESDLMELAGWSSRSMLRVYGRSAAQKRAVAAHSRVLAPDRY